MENLEAWNRIKLFKQALIGCSEIRELDGLCIDHGINSTDALHYLLQNGDKNLIECYLKNPNKYLEDISVAYEKLTTKSIPISTEIEKLLTHQIVNDRMKYDGRDVSDPILPQEISDRLDFLIYLLKMLTGDEHLSNDKIVCITLFIGINIKTLKNELPASYDRIPWEELDFCIAIFLSNFVGFRYHNLTNEPAYSLILHQRRFIFHMRVFLSVMEQFRTEFTAQFQRKINFQRFEVIEQYKNNYGDPGNYEELLKDYELVRNVYSLSKIYYLLKMVCRLDLKGDKLSRNKMVIERTLQVIGECLRNTLKGPKTTDELRSKIEVWHCVNLLKYLYDVRNAISHEEFLQQRFDKLEKSQKLFDQLQIELGNLLPRFSQLLAIENQKAVVNFINEFQKSESLIIQQRMLMGIRISKSFDPSIDIDANAVNIPSFKNVIKKVEIFADYSNKNTAPALLETVRKTNQEWKQYEEMLTTTLSELKSNIQFILKNGINDNSYVLKNITKFSNNVFCPLSRLFRNVYEQHKPVNDRIGLPRMTEFFDSLYGRSMTQVKYLLREDNKVQLNSNQTSLMDVVFPDCTTNNISLMDQAVSILQNMSLKDAAKINLLPEDLENLQQHVQKIHSSKSITTAVLEIAEFLKGLDPEKIVRIIRMANVSDENLKKFWITLKGKEENYSFKNIIKFLSDKFKKKKKFNIETLLKDYDITVEKFVNIAIGLCLQKKENALKIRLKSDQKKVEAGAISIEKQKEIFENRKELFLSLMPEWEQDVSINQVAVEMILLDITEIVKKISGFSHDKNYLDRYLPLPVGRLIRNYLAHGDPFLEVLPGCLSATIFANAEAFVVDDLQSSNHYPIGHVFTTTVSKLRDRFEDNLKWLTEQENLYLAAKCADFNKVAECVANGGDIKGLGQSTIGQQTVVHFSLDNFSWNENEFLRFFIKYIKEKGKINESERFLEWILTENHWEGIRLSKTMCLESQEFFADEIDALLAAKDKSDWKEMQLCLIRAAICRDSLEVIQELFELDDNDYLIEIILTTVKYGRIEILEYIRAKNPDFVKHILLRSNTLILAILNGHEEITKSLLELHGNSIEIEVETDRNVIQIAAECGHAKIIDLLITKKIKFQENDQPSPLLLAAKNGHWKCVELLLIHHTADLNLGGNNGYNPLHWAAQQGHLKVVELLLNQSGILIDALTKDGETPLILAASKGHDACVHLLLQAQADVNLSDNSGYNSLHSASGNGHSNILAELLGRKADVHAKTLEDKETPLALAAISGHLDCARLLIESGAVIDDTNNDGKTPLMLASRNGFIEIMRLLLSKGANIDAKNYYDKYTSLIFATMNGDYDSVKFLIESDANVNATDQDGHTALHSAATVGHTQIVQLLINSGANVNAAHNIANSTALHSAASAGSLDSVTLLLNAGARIDDVQRDGSTALHFSASKGLIEIVQLLIERSANVNAVQPKRKYTPLMLAIQNGHLECAELLLKGGADVMATDKIGFTSLHLAAEQGSFEMLQLILEYTQDINVKTLFTQATALLMASKRNLKLMELLVSAGAEINVRDKYGYTPLHNAAGNNCIEIIHYLMAKHANCLHAVTCTDMFAYTPLISAVFFGQLEAVEALLGYYANNDEANIDAQDTDGGTALHMAASINMGQPEILKCLVDANANVNATGMENNITPLMCAAGTGNLKCVEILIATGKVNVDACSKNGQTAIMRGAIHGNQDCVMALLTYGADIKLVDDTEHDFLYYAKLNKNLDIDEIFKTISNLNKL